MYSLILCFVVCIFLSFRSEFAYAERARKAVSIGGAFFWAFCLMLPGVVPVYVISSIASAQLPVETREVWRKPLVSVITSEHPHGAFVYAFSVGAGHSESTQYIDVRAMNRDGSSTHYRLADDSSLSIKEEGNSSQAYWRHSARFYRTTGSAAKWALVSDQVEIEGSATDQFVVPVGTVVRTFQAQ